MFRSYSAYFSIKDTNINLFNCIKKSYLSRKIKKISVNPEEKVVSRKCKQENFSKQNLQENQKLL